MKIAYLINYSLDDSCGVVQKIKQQSKQWILQGHIVYFVSLKTMTVYDSNQNIMLKQKPLNIKFGRFGTALKSLYNAHNAHKLFNSIEVDCIYMRYQLYMPFINKIFKNNKVIMEINSDDKQEYKLHSHLTSIYNKLTRDLFLRHINAFVSVSFELKNKFEYLKRPIKVIANGIDVNEYKISMRKPNKETILVFIGTPNQPWHGLDKVKKLAKHFKKYQFYIIGTDGKDTHNIKYFGFLSSSESTAIINRCDIGIGTLSLFKTGLKEASPLKTRQYLACGLPLIYAYRDTDILDKAEFGLELQNSENNIDYEKIEKFVNNVFNNKDTSKKARKFAEYILNYEKKEEERLNFFKRVVYEN